LKTPRLVVICGPTATGKTEVAFELAKNLKTEIISFDSIQVYKELNIGAAKPTLELRKIIPHHLVDEIDPFVNFSAGDFRKRALEEILKLSTKKYIVLVGGTGFYLQALIKGMYAIPPIDPKIKEDLLKEAESRGMAALYDELKIKDGEYAKKIHPNDRYRILRGLEVLRSGVKSISEMKEEFKPEDFPFEVLQFGLRRKKEVLKEAIQSRTEFMLASGLIEETKSLLQKYPRNLRPLESVGYKEVVKFVSGELPQENLVPAIVSSTLQLAKRQSTWFKRDKKIQWFDPDDLGVSKTVETITTSLDN
jgi:tRNA dimethylallyltransferase